MNEYNILITGGTGFIGETLVRELLKLNYKILIIARNYDKIFDNKNVTWISADIAHEKKYIEKVKSFSPTKIGFVTIIILNFTNAFIFAIFQARS